MRRVKLGEIARISSGGTPSRTKQAYWGGNIPWVKTTQIQNCVITEADVDEWITEEGLKYSSAKMVSKGTLLMAMYGQGKTRGQVAILDFDATINQACAAIELDNDVSQPFIYQQLMLEYEDIRNMSNAGGQENLSAGLIREIPILLPPLPEQKAIADLLSIWDAAIEKTEQLIKAKEKQFQWLLNELITKPSQSGKWKEVRLGDVAMMSSGGTPKSSVSEYYDGDILWVSIKDITQQGMFINDTERKLTALGLRNSAAKIFPKGCVLYAMYASIGEVSITNCDVSTSQAILGIQPNDCVNNHFLYHFLVSLKEKIKLQGQSGTQSNLNAQMVKDFRLPLPSIKEQNRIVMHLEICKQEMQLLTFLANKYKTQKRGLMQKLLNGQWRVKGK